MFQKASQVKKNLKVLIYGPSGTGKTHLALTFPTPAVVDMEGGTDLFADRFDFSVLHSKDYREVIKAVDHVANAKNGFETLVIDPVTVLWQVLMEAGQIVAEKRAVKGKRNPDEATLALRDWGIIKQRVNALYTRLVNMPCHVVVVGRIKDINEKKGNDIVKVGERVDAEKSTEYVFDIVIKLIMQGGKRVGIVEKDRSGKLQGQQIENPSFASFSEVLALSSSGKRPKQQDPADAAKSTAGDLEFDPDNPGFEGWDNKQWGRLKAMAAKHLGYKHAKHVSATLGKVFDEAAKKDLTYVAAWNALADHQAAKDSE